MGVSDRKEAAQLKRRLERLGLQVSRGGNGHYQVRDGGGRLIGTFGATPNGGQRWLKNLRADLRRNGVAL